MNLLAFLRPTPTPINDTEPMRSRNGQFAASPRTMRTLNRRASVNAQLGVYVALVPLAKRKEETEAVLGRRG